MLSQQPGGLAGAIASARQRWQQRGGRLGGDKAHVFHSAEELINSDYARQHPFTDQQKAALRNAAGFFDPRTGQTVIIAGNVGLRAGETPQAALTRVLLHERVGHDGLNALLQSSEADGGGPTLIQKRWANLQQHLLLHQRSNLDSIAAEPGYEHLKGNTQALALEWFARQAEARPELLTQPSLVMRMWDNFKDGVADLMARLGLDPLQGKDLDTQVMDLLTRARQSAVQGGSRSQGGALGQDLQYSMGGENQTAHEESSKVAKNTAPTKPALVTDGSDVPPLQEGEKIIKSSPHGYVFESNGRKWVRFFAPAARSANTARKGGKGGGEDQTIALWTPEGRIYVVEGQHRLNGVVLEGTTNMNSVAGHPLWLEYEYHGDTTETGDPPAYSKQDSGKPWINVNKKNPWDGEDGY